MEEQQTGGRLPGEVVEIYRQPRARERTFSLSRPLPRRMAPPPPAAPAGRRKRRRGLRVFLLLTAAVVVLTAAAALLRQPETVRRDPFDYDPERQETEEAAITIPTYPTGEGAVLEVTRERRPTLTAQEVYRQVNPAVVTVMARLRAGASVGTGVIFRSDGYILTNYHVIEGGRECEVVLDSGARYMAMYVAGDRENDLAILKITREDLPAAEFGDSDLLTVGDKVYAIGNPLGVELRGTLTDGIVSAINRDVNVDGRTMTLVQTNAALNSGNSGGPLINDGGQVVGINTIKMSSSYSNIEGLGFAIPSAALRYMVNDLLTWGEVRPEPTLGIEVALMATQPADGVHGLKVIGVNRDSAADLAGIQVDDYLLAVAGEPLATSQDLLRLRRQYGVGDAMPITLWREGNILEVTVVMTAPAETED